MHSDNNQAGIPILSRLRLRIRKLGQAIDARVRPGREPALRLRGCFFPIPSPLKSSYRIGFGDDPNVMQHVLEHMLPPAIPSSRFGGRARFQKGRPSLPLFRVSFEPFREAVTTASEARSRAGSRVVIPRHRMACTKTPPPLQRARGVVLPRRRVPRLKLPAVWETRP